MREAFCSLLLSSRQDDKDLPNLFLYAWNCDNISANGAFAVGSSALLESAQFFKAPTI
jgi:hypothetical protein